MKTYGAGKAVSYFDWQHYIMQLINQGMFEVAYDENNALKLTPISQQVLFEKRKVDFVKPVAFTKKKAAAPVKAKTKKEQLHDDLFEVLRRLRKSLADASNMPPYLVFNDATLHEMAEERPITEDEMLHISGISERKFEMYGAVFIKTIVEFISGQTKAGKKVKGSTQLETLKLYESGMGVQDMAKTRGLNPVTIYSHLAHLYKQGHAINIEQFVSAEEQAVISKAIGEVGSTDSLKAIFDHLNEAYEYHKIRLGIAFHEKAQQEVNS